ncbi:MAG: UPF0280 family protein [Solirubrobacterales bacterium]
MVQSTIRDYRERHEGEDLIYFQVVVKQTDLSIGIDRTAFEPGLPAEVERWILKLRGDLETYIETDPFFRDSLEPMELLPGAPPIARAMALAAVVAEVGPMAAVAGAFAEEIGRMLMKRSPNVIVENGGDLFIATNRERLVGVHAGDSAFSGKIAVRIKPEESPLGLCTSSGTVGPSFSFGKADAAIVKAASAYLADAVASGVGNRVLDKENLVPAIEYGQELPGVTGLLVIKEDRLAAWGEIELVPLTEKLSQKRPL